MIVEWVTHHRGKMEVVKYEVQIHDVKRKKKVSQVMLCSILICFQNGVMFVDTD